MTNTTQTKTAPGTVLWQPAPDARATSRLGRFLTRLEAHTGRSFEDYEHAWQWSVDNLEDFWEFLWHDFAVSTSSPYEQVLAERTMPGARWFEGARINYSRMIFERLAEKGSATAISTRSQTTGSSELSGTEMLDLIGRIQSGLTTLGVVPGDRVAGYLPNIPEAVAAYLAVAGLGATWCSVPPEMGPKSALDRLQPLEPRVLIAVDGYRWGDREIPRRTDVERIASGLPGVKVVELPYLGMDGDSGWQCWDAFTATRADPTTLDVPFEHPLVVLFSSGTTGAPKAIVHSHGGLLLEHLKSLSLQMDLGPDDTTFWFSTTGWMVWNLQVSALLVGARLVLVDGDPNWPTMNGPWSQWAITEETGATFLATGAAYLGACARAGLRPRELWNLSTLREINSSGSPLAADVAAWVYEAVNPSLLLAPTSGGTDICSAFVGGSPLTPVFAGEMSCRPLGVATDSVDEQGRPVVGVAGELVVSLPMPSMPVFFWGDPANARYLSSYFEEYPGRWRHGDWLVHTVRNSWVITGRSDATLNRGGVRLGTAEYYGILDSLGSVLDSMVLHFEDSTGMGTLLLAVHAAPGVDEQTLSATIRSSLRSELSPRHVPDLVVFVPGIPRNRTGKRLEIPIKRLVKGATGVDILDPSVLVDPDSLPEVLARLRAALGTRILG